jgi:hypothetical protein
MSMRIERTIITPEMAVAWLDTNLNNRNINKRIVDRYVADMLSGTWKENAETIKIGVSGNLIDGQHRLAACIMSGVSFTTLVAMDVEDEVFPTIDSGRPRSVSDVLGIMKETDTRSLAAALSILGRYETGSLGSQVKRSSQVTLDQLARHPGIRESVIRTKGHPVHIRSRYLVFTDYVGGLVDRDKTTDFINKLKSGENMTSGSPALLLRNRLLSDSIPGTTTVKDVMVVALYIKALNAMFTGKAIGALRYSTKEAFPSIDGYPYGQLITP